MRWRVEVAEEVRLNGGDSRGGGEVKGGGSR